jgi:N-acetylmuramoyl-L-alanine amidase
MNVRKIYIDIGHGENGDMGAVNNELIEHKMNVVTANALKDRLIEHGFEVMIESGNQEITASARSANNFGADILLSCHYNAGGGDRGEVIYSWKNNSLELANVVATGLKNASQSEVRVYKSKPNSTNTAEYFGILRASNMPSVIIEPCFIDNAIDRQLADTIEEQAYIGYCIADAIAEVYGGEKEVEQWKIDIMNKAVGYELISANTHKPDEVATKWFMLAVIMNMLEKYILPLLNKSK